MKVFMLLAMLAVASDVEGRAQFGSQYGEWGYEIGGYGGGGYGIGGYPVPCFYLRVHYIGFPLNKPGGNNNYGGMDSAEECQSLCQNTAGCEWFNWALTGFPEWGCWLKTGKGSWTKDVVGGVSGPRKCPVGIKDYLLTPQSRKLQTDRLISACARAQRWPFMFSRCFDDVQTFWPVMAKVLLDAFCDKFDVGCNDAFSSCDNCLHELDNMGALMADNVWWAVELLQGEAYCGNTPRKQPRNWMTCKEMVAWTTPVSMKFLSEAIPDREAGVCYKSQGLCGPRE